MNEVTISREVLTRVLGTASGVILDALNTKEDEQKPQSEIDNLFLTAFQGKLDKAIRDGKDEGFGRGKRESLTEIEKWIGDEYKVAPDGDIKSQIQKLHQAAAKVDIDPAQIEKSEIFQSKLNETVEAVKSKFAEKETEFEKAKEQWRRQRINSVLEKKAKKLLEENNFVLPENPEIAQTHFEVFKNSLWSDGINYKLGEKEDEFMITDQDGNPLKDELHNVVAFSDFGIGKAKKFFPQRSGDGKDVSGNQTQPPSGGNGYKFKDMNAAMDAYNAETDATKRGQIREAMKAIKVE